MLSLSLRMTLAARECSVKEREAENKKTELHSKILTTRKADMIRCSTSPRTLTLVILSKHGSVKDVNLHIGKNTLGICRVDAA